WSADDKRAFLAQTLDTWYPPEQAEAAQAPADATAAPAADIAAQPEVAQAIDSLVGDVLSSVPAAAQLPPDELAALLGRILAEEAPAAHASGGTRAVSDGGSDATSNRNHVHPLDIRGRRGQDPSPGEGGLQLEGGRGRKGVGRHQRARGHEPTRP